MTEHPIRRFITRLRVTSWLRDIALVGLIVAGFSWWQNRDLLPSDGEFVVEPFKLVSLHGEVVNVAPHAEKPTIIYFFAPWCSVCRFSIGNLDSLSDKDIQVVRIALDFESAEEVEQFVQNVGIDAPVLLGNDEVGRRFLIKGYPTYYVLDQQFSVVGKAMGYSSAAGLKVRSWLAQLNSSD